MKLYNPKKFKELYYFKENIKDENIKETIEEMIKIYNYMYIKFKDYLKEIKEKRINYMKLDQLSIENKQLKERIERKNIMIAEKDKVIFDLKREIKELKEGTND